MGPEEIARSIEDDGNDMNLLDQALSTPGIKALRNGKEAIIALKHVKPDELRRLADALEQLGVSEVRAVSNFERPQGGQNGFG